MDPSGDPARRFTQPAPRGLTVLYDERCAFCVRCAAWLGRESVSAVGFFANGTGPVEIVAKVGNFFISGHGIEIEDDLTVNCCERHRARFSQSRIEDWDMSTNTTRFTWGNPAAQEAADRLAVLLTEQVDPEIALVVLGG